MTDIILFPLQLIRTGGLSQFAAVAAQPDSAAASGRKPGEPQFLAAKLPDQLTILSWGAQPDALGYVVVDGITLELLPVNQKNFNLLRIPILIPAVWGTNSSGKIMVVKDQAVAALGTPVVEKGVGVQLRDIEWTEAGRKEILNFSNLTPTVWLNDESKVIGLSAVTLSKRDGGMNFRKLPEFLALSAQPPSLATVPKDVRGFCRVVAAFDRANAKLQPLSTQRPAILPASVGLHGIERMAAAFNAAKSTLQPLSARQPVNVPINQPAANGNALRGKARAAAAFNRENLARLAK